MVKNTFLSFLFIALISIDVQGQRRLEGYRLTNTSIDTLFGEFSRPTLTSKSDEAYFNSLNLSGELFEYVPFENDFILLQRLSGEDIRLYRNLESDNSQFFIFINNDLSRLTEDRINVELATHFSECQALSNAMAYTKVKYKVESLVRLFDQFTQCVNESNSNWRRSDSVEVNLSLDLFSGFSVVQDQPLKDHSGDYNNANFQGWGFSLTAFSQRKIRLIGGLKVYDVSTNNPLANVTPFNNSAFSSEVQYRWTTYEVPLAAAYNFKVNNWHTYLGLGGAVMFTNNLSVSEWFEAPFLTEPQRIGTQLVVNQYFGVSGMAGIERKLGARWILGLHYEIQRSQMDFNLVRINRNPEQKPPILATYQVSSPLLFASATDLTKFTFTTHRLSVSLKFRAFWKYQTFN